ncbi:MAG: hypothetical protein LDL13_04060 [Calditerrivibrio sp.]|nr:hypothetical protein [Calditerrivibrio sp.]
MRRFLVFALVSIFLTFSCAPDPFRESFENAKKLASANKLEEAHEIYRDLCQKVPENKEYCEEFNKLNLLIFNKKYRETTEKISYLKSKTPLIPIPDIVKLEDDVKKLYSYNLEKSKIDTLSGQIANERSLSESKKSVVLKDSEDFFKKKEYSRAVKNLREYAYLDPSLFELKINEYKNFALSTLYPQILKLTDNDDWLNATPMIVQVYDIDSSYQNIASLFEESKSKNNADYYLKKAEESKKQKKLDLAISYYDIAMQYTDDAARVKELYIKSLAEFAEMYFQLGIDYAQQDFVWQSYENIKKAYDIIKKIPIEKRGMIKAPKKELNKYYDNLYLKAKKSEDAGKIGLTYLYYRILFNLNPTYPDIKDNLKKLDEKILARAIKSLAIIPFKSPKNAPDAGGLFTSNIMLSLYNELKDDLKIIERESTDVLIKEFELNLAAQSQKQGGLKIASADYFLLGDVLDYKVESSTQEGKKSVRVKTRVDILPNPEYEEWQKISVKLQQEGKEVPPAPSRTIEKPIFEDVKYSVKYFKKVSVISISYRIVDVNGKLVHTGIVDIKKDAIDESSEGVEIGDFKIPFKVAQLPTDSELLKKAQDEAIAKIKNETKNIFKNAEEKYINQAKEYEKDNNIVEALEKYVDGIMIMKKKNIPSEALEERIIKYMDAIVNM